MLDGRTGKEWMVGNGQDTVEGMACRQPAGLRDIALVDIGLEDIAGRRIYDGDGGSEHAWGVTPGDCRPFI